MNILYLGGELRNILGSAAAMSERGHHVFYVNLAKKPFEKRMEALQVETREGCPVQIKQINIPYTKRENLIKSKIKPTNISTRALSLLNETSPSAIISRPENWHVAHFISRKLHIPHVHYLTDIRGLKLRSFIRYMHKYSEILHAPLSITYNIALSHLSDFTVTTSKTIEKVLKNAGVRRTATTRPPYVRIAKVPTQVHKKLKVELPKNYALIVITLGRHGNVEIDLAIFRIVLAIARRVPDVLFVVIGTSLEETSRLRGTFNAGDNIKFMGTIADDYLLALLYRNVSCVLCPILVPGLSTRLFEAFFYARPIITTKMIADYYGGLVSGEHCIIEEDFDKWPGIIRDIVNNNYLKEKLEKGARRYYDKNFSSERHVLILERILSSIITNRTYATTRYNRQRGDGKIEDLRNLNR